jgi:16S rRNA (cytidine1402-2'-O)-methyltransferase
MSKLYLVPTPIGNLEDITLRALRVLKESDLILAEDTRKTSILLKKYNITGRLISHHKFNEHKTAQDIANRIKNGEQIALVSDAGTPSISDPGYLLIKTCIELNVPVECLPGPTALIPALVNSGFPNDTFCFEGFLPHKKGRKTRLSRLAYESRTIILYESPHRLIKTLSELSASLGSDRACSVSRELTKVHEETIRGTLAEAIDYFSKKPVRGEFVIVISPC